MLGGEVSNGGLLFLVSGPGDWGDQHRHSGDGVEQIPIRVLSLEEIAGHLPFTGGDGSALLISFVNLENDL